MIGISVDAPAKNKAFAESLGLTYPVLSDPKRTVAREYGVLIPMVRLARRVTFLIDKNGIIQEIQPGGEAIDPNNALETCSLLGRKQEPAAKPVPPDAKHP